MNFFSQKLRHFLEILWPPLKLTLHPNPDPRFLPLITFQVLPRCGLKSAFIDYLCNHTRDAMNAQDVYVRHEIVPDEVIENFDGLRISGSLLVPFLDLLLGHVVGTGRLEGVQMAELKTKLICLNERMRQWWQLKYDGWLSWVLKSFQGFPPIKNKSSD